MGTTKKNKRGQAAIEFLTTYGWAVLVIAIVLVALGWLGIFRTASTVPDRCAFQQGLECSAAKVSLVQNSMRLGPLVLTNKGTQAINIVGIACTNNPDRGASLTTTFGSPIRLDAGQKLDVVGSSLVLCNDYFSGTPASGRYQVGDTFNGRLEVYYATDYDAGAAKARILYGDLTAKVQPG
jgi:hypothetical protein